MTHAEEDPGRPGHAVRRRRLRGRRREHGQEADLDGVKGIGPVMSKRILDERKKGKFKDWPDLVARVKGLGDTAPPSCRPKA